MLLQACLNGARDPDEHPALPVTPAQLAADALAVRRVGAGALHVHVKNPAGRDTLDREPTRQALVAIRDAVPTMPVGLTTAAWTVADPAERVRAVSGWTGAACPDFASVNWHEEGADEVAAVLLDRGIGIEAGVWNSEGLAAWSRSPWRDTCLRVLVELPDGLTAAGTAAAADELVAGVRRVLPDAAILLHGEGSSAWPALRHARALGVDGRIGLEDTLDLPDGTRAPGNAALVAAWTCEGALPG